MARLIRPTVTTVTDNPIVQIKLDPAEDEVDLDALLQEVLIRFEFVLGTAFDFQFLNLQGTRVMALRRYVVTEVTEQVATSRMSHYQTMTKTIYNRRCEPIGDLIVFDETANVLRDRPRRRLSDEGTVLDNMTTAELQAHMKALTGKGFVPGTSRDTMIAAIREAS